MLFRSVTRSTAFAAAVLGAFSAPSRAEVTEVSLARQFGLHYLPLVLMEKHRLIEQEAKRAGIELKGTWTRLSGGTSVNEALISDSIHIVAGGTGPLVRIWDRTLGNLDVKGLAAVSDVPMVLVSRDPQFKSLKEIRPQDRIALPAAKTSMQAITLQMAAAKIWGDDEYQKLDQQTVSMAHPDAVAAVLSGMLEVNAHFSAPPYSYRELKDSHVHRVMSSFDVYGGPATLIVLYEAKKFYDENPKVNAVVLAALEEAMQRINGDRRAALKDYLELTGEKMDEDTIEQFVSDQDIRFRAEPSGIQDVARFLNRVGAVKNRPKSWQDMFFPMIHSRQGS